MENSIKVTSKKVVGETKLGTDGITRIWTDKGEGKFGWRRVRGNRVASSGATTKVKKEKVVFPDGVDPNIGKFKIRFKGYIIVRFDEVSQKYSFAGRTRKGDHWSGEDVTLKRIQEMLEGSKRVSEIPAISVLKQLL